MPITELVFSNFQPTAGKAALTAVRTHTKPFDGLTGIQSRRIGHILRHNAEDISESYRAIIQIQWDQPQSFHTGIASPQFHVFISHVKEHLAGPSTPQLYEPLPSYAQDEPFPRVPATELIVTGEVATENKSHVESAWATLISALEKERRKSKHWGGWGIENAGGSWNSIVEFVDVEELDAVTGKEEIKDAIKVLNQVSGLEEFVVSFES